jgi:hypothetical protein
MKGKDPALLVYTGDFIAQTQTMNWTDRGMYAYMKCVFHQNGWLSKEQIVGILGLFPVSLEMKWTQDKSNGTWNDPEVLRSIEMRSKARLSAQENGKKGGRPKKQTESNGLLELKPKEEPKKKLLKEDGNEIENINDTEIKAAPEFVQPEPSISMQTIEPYLRQKCKAKLADALWKLFGLINWRLKRVDQLKEVIDGCAKYPDDFLIDELIETAWQAGWSGLFYGGSTDLKYQNWLKIQNAKKNQKPNIDQIDYESYKN